ncbi:MAG: hypothetical protein ACIAXF_17215 [Phycisphaerales bacterium JB063]
MTQAPYPQHPARPYVPPNTPPSNALGLTGFILSIVGMVLCLGVLCPVGALVSLVAVFRPSRGFAIAGLIIGVLGTLLWALLWTLYFSLPSLVPDFDLYYAQTEIDDHYLMYGVLPSEADGQQMIDWYDDEWGTVYRYHRVDDQGYEIISAGPDRQFATADDVVNSYPAPTGWGGPTQWDASTEQVVDDAHREIERTYEGEYNSPPWDRVQNTMGQRFKDEWGNALRYNAGGGRDYELRSAGPDGRFNTPDDLTWSYTLGEESGEGVDAAEDVE